MIYAKVGESQQTLASVKPTGYVEMNSPRPEGDFWVANASGDWVQSPVKAAEQALQDMREECKIITDEIEKIDDNHSSAIATESEWRTYRNQCRDYVQVVGGVLTIVGNKPVRPTGGA